MSIDGYVADERGNFDWAAPDDEVHSFVNELARPVETYLLGRRMYETLLYWEHPPDLDAEPQVIRDFAAIWRAANKVVYSTTLDKAESARTRIEHRFDPAAVKQMKEEGDLTVGGPHLAAEAIRSGVVDDFQLIVVPVVVGGGNRALPEGVHLDLELVDERRFRGGAVHLHYRARRDD
jgi:dihydrofolate reductase